MECDGESEVRVFPSPGGLEYTAQMLCCAANGIVTLGSLPVFAHAGLGNRPEAGPLDRRNVKQSQ